MPHTGRSCALLSVWGSPILGRVLRGLLDLGVHVDCVILDEESNSKVNAAKMQELWNERTGNRLPPLPLAQAGADRVPVFVVDSHSSETCIGLVRERGISLLLNSGTPRILKAGILHAPEIGVLNCHPGLLPDFRGCTCVEWAVYYDRPVGVTAHLMTEKIDEGPIVMARAVDYRPDDGYLGLRTKANGLIIELLRQAAKAVLASPEDYLNRDYVRDGAYHKVIDPEKMQMVMDKLAAGTYRPRGEGRLCI